MTTTPSPLLSMSTTSLSPSSSSSLPSLPSLPSSTRRLQETRQQTKFHDLKIICRFHGGWSTSDDRFFQLPEPRADSTNRSSTCKLIYKPLSALRTKEICRITFLYKLAMSVYLCNKMVKFLHIKATLPKCAGRNDKRNFPP